MDNLNIHYSESLVKWVALVSDEDINLGKKGRSGILKNRHTRAEYLADPTHWIVFHHTPRHCSWLNQISIWFSILMRNLLKRGSFDSVDQLVEKVSKFVDYYNRTMAKPFRWIYEGTSLTV